MTNVTDALYAAQLGIDAIGLIFYEKSSRYVDLNQAQKIAKLLPPFVTAVAVLVNPTTEYVNAVLRNVAIDLLQFHGEETAEFCESFSKPYIKAVPMTEGMNVRRYAKLYPNAKGFLFDTSMHGQFGGTGKSFDWNLIPKEFSKPIILAGGLTPENVGEAISKVHPYAVDVISGIEKTMGIKDELKMKNFMEAVHSAI
jgi:phosphoribosylanthranilate isomerase